MKLMVVSHACVVDVNQRVFRELERMGHQVGLVVPSRWRHEYSPSGIRPARLNGFSGPIMPLPVWPSGWIPGHVYRCSIDAVLSQFAPDVVYVEEEPYSLAAFQWVRAASKAKRDVLFFSAQNIVKTYPTPFRLSEEFVWTHSRAAVCVTANVVRALQGRGYSGAAYVVPHGIDTTSFRPGAADRDLRTKLRLRPRVIAYLGRLVEEKGIRVLLEAYASLGICETTSLLCLGAGPLAKACRSTPGVVVVEGLAHSDVPDYIRLADLVVLPSLTRSNWKEQLGRAAIEAMACGLPVIVSNSGELPNLVEAGRTGLIVPEGDSSALASAIGRLLDDERIRAELGAAARLYAESVYSLPVVADRLARALQIET